MNVTFFIGNGFDLNLKMETDYKKFYKYVIKKELNNELVKSIKENYELWADLELGLGGHLKNVKTAEEIEQFLNNKENIEKHLIDYLKLENDRFEIVDEKILGESFRNGVVNFYKTFSKEEIQHYQKITNDNIVINYRFINFNYTDTLDRIIAASKKSCVPFSTHTYRGSTNQDNVFMPLHIHGTLSDGAMILALNDVSQIDNDELRKNPKLTRFIVKTILNDELGNFKNRDAQSLIDESVYICVFGMSIGDTDNIWWQKIVAWLLKNSDRRVVLFVKDDTIVSGSATANLRYNLNKSEDFLKHDINLSNEEYEKLASRFIIVKNSNIFDLEGFSIKEKEQSEEKENG